MSDQLPLNKEEMAWHARALLEDPLLTQVFLELSEGAVQTWMRSTSAQQREEQWHMVIAIEAIKQQLQSRLTDVKLGDRARARIHGRQMAGV